MNHQPDSHGLNRRAFLKATAAGAAVAAVPGLSRAEGDGDGPKAAYRKLGRTGLEITAVSMGAFATKEEALFEAAFGMGINFVDTARVYLDGASERKVGNALKAHDGKVYVATKVWLDNKEKMMQDVDKSMEELMLDQVDILFLHKCGKREDVLSEDNRAVVKDAKAKGRTRFLGVSTHENEVEVINAVLEDPEKLFDVLMVKYNFESPPEVKEAIARAANAGIGVLAIKTLAGGYKTDEYGDITPYQAAIKWALMDPNITSVVPSIVDLQQLRDDFAVMGMPLEMSKEDVAALRRYGDEIAPYYCRMCGACKASCARGLDIPNINRCLMYAEGYGRMDLAQAAYGEIAPEAGLFACAQCSTCTAACRGHLDLAERMSKARALFA